MSAYTQAQKIADEGLRAGSAIWDAVDAAHDAELVAGRDMVERFELMLEAPVDGISRDGRDLFEAFAMKAIPNSALDGAKRTIIARTADNAWRSFVEALRADEAADMRGAE